MRRIEQEKVRGVHRVLEHEIARAIDVDAARAAGADHRGSARGEVEPVERALSEPVGAHEQRSPRSQPREPVGRASRGTGVGRFGAFRELDRPNLAARLCAAQEGNGRPVGRNAR